MQKLVNMCGPIEDPSPLAIARRISKSSHLEDSLSFKSTVGLITSSKYSFLQFDTDSCLLSLIQVTQDVHFLLFCFVYSLPMHLLVVNLQWMLWLSVYSIFPSNIFARDVT
jgi:hypothetical protein